MDVALLIPIYNEPTSDVFGNAAAMLQDIIQTCVVISFFSHQGFTAGEYPGPGNRDIAADGHLVRVVATAAP